MTKHIIRDYFWNLRLSNLKQNKAAVQCIYGMIYIFCMSVCTNRVWSDQSAWRNVIVENALLLPMLFSYGSASVHSIYLDKMMYLCPMDPEERRNYIYGSYCLRTGVHMLVGLAGLGIVIWVSGCDILTAIQILLNHMLVAVMVSHGQRTGDKRRRKVIVTGELIFVTALFSNAMQFAVIVLGQRALWVRLVLFFVFCSVQLPLEIWYVRYVKKALRAAVLYESSLKSDGTEKTVP